MCVCLSQSRKLWREGCSGTGPQAPKRASPQSTAQRRHRGSSRNSGRCPRRSSGRTEALAGCVSGSVQASERDGPGWRSWGRGGSREARHVCGRRTGPGPASTGLVLRSPRRATRVISAARRAPAPGAASSPASPAAGIWLHLEPLHLRASRPSQPPFGEHPSRGKTPDAVFPTPCSPIRPPLSPWGPSRAPSK